MYIYIQGTNVLNSITLLNIRYLCTYSTFQLI